MDYDFIKLSQRDLIHSNFVLILVVLFLKNTTMSKHICQITLEALFHDIHTFSEADSGITSDLVLSIFCVHYISKLVQVFGPDGVKNFINQKPKEWHIMLWMAKEIVSSQIFWSLDT